jgi:hypothetical protein
MKTFQKVFNMERIYKIFQKIVLAAFLLFFGQACIDLEEDISSIILLENLKSEADITAALTPIYRIYLDTYDQVQRRQIVGYGSDDITTYGAGNKDPLRIYDRFDYGNGENSDNIWMPTPFDNYWRVIYYTNTLIEGLKTSSATEEEIKAGEAEARFFRAKAYLDLVKGWGNMPLILDGMTPTGEELRMTVLENYQAIETDLKIAEVGLKVPGNAKAGKISSAVAKTLLADLYLTWSGWPIKDASKYAMAASKAKEIIDMNYFTLLPIDKLWLEENGNSLESIFFLEYSLSENKLSTLPVRYSMSESRGWSDLFPERQFFYDFPEGLRKDYTFDVLIPRRARAGAYMVVLDPPFVAWEESINKHPTYRKFTISGNLTDFNSPKGLRPAVMYRYAEILLIYAEASARANGGNATGEALEALNQIKRRAAGLPYDQADPSVDETSATADDIFVEKKWEMAGEGQRWYDLIRMERVHEAAARRDPTEEVALSKSPSDISWHQYISPIPYSTISTSNLIQNPEGFKAQ